MQENNLLENENLLKTVTTHDFCITVAKTLLGIFAIPILLLILSALLALSPKTHDPENAIITFGIMSVFALALMSGCMKVITQQITLTNKRIIVNMGWINHKTLEIIPQKIESITVKQGLFGKIFNFGSIYIRGLGGTEDPLMYVPTPLELKQTIQNIVQGAEPMQNK